MLESTFHRACCTIALAAIAAILGCGRPSPTTHERDLERDGIRPAASNALLDLDDRKFELWQDATESKATVLIFARTDCPISNRYAPTIKALHETYKPRGVGFYLVYVDPNESPDEIRRHLADYDYPCAGLRDPTHTLVKTIGVTVTPEAVVYNAKREIVYRGRINDLYLAYGQARNKATTHELADAIENTLADKPVVERTTEAVGCPIADLR